MNANTAMKINDAITQAVDCGEHPAVIRGQVEKALRVAQLRRTEREIAALQDELDELRKEVA